MLKNLGHTYKADIWSIGVILYILFSGKMPFKGETCQEIYNSIKKSEFKFPAKEWAYIPDSAK